MWLQILEDRKSEWEGSQRIYGLGDHSDHTYIHTSLIKATAPRCHDVVVRVPEGEEHSDTPSSQSGSTGVELAGRGSEPPRCIQRWCKTPSVCIWHADTSALQEEGTEFLQSKVHPLLYSTPTKIFN